MREGKPYAKLLLHLAQLVVLFSLIQAINTQVWYTGVVDIEYTDGLPEGAGMEVELEVDQKTADGSIHVDGFITFLQWQIPEMIRQSILPIQKITTGNQWISLHYLRSKKMYQS